ncbi:MAG: DUF4330 domain-containing protein [Defluviitaleaceae bacterium]|nr:DUF4330 domain-containing protein [Defluviitaleaceae bacterium]
MKKFNIIDALIILAVLAVGAGAVWFFTTAADTEDGYVYFVVEMRQAMPTVPAQISAAVGGEIRDSVRNYLLGQIVDVRHQPAYGVTFDNTTATFNNVPVPERYDVFITIRGRGTFSPSQILTEGQPVRVGMEKFLRGRGFAAIGVVVEVTPMPN